MKRLLTALLAFRVAPRLELASDPMTPATCIASGLPLTTAADDDQPVSGSAYFYVVRARDVCGAGVVHRGSDGVPVMTLGCPAPLLMGGPARKSLQSGG